MTEEIPDSGIVTAIIGNKVTVELQRGGGCKSCAMHGLCMTKSTPAIFHIVSSLPLQVGDRVELDVSAGGRVLSSLLIFGTPVAALFIGFLIAQNWFNELISIFFAFASLALSFYLVRFCDRKWGSKLNIEIARKL